MSSTNRFMTLSEFCKNVLNFLTAHFSVGKTVLSLFLFSSLFVNPVTLLAGENKPVGNRKSSATETHEGLLASPGLMIEHLVLQIDGKKGSAAGTGEPTGNSSAAFFSSIPNIKPVEGSISSDFGMRLHPIYNVPFFHSGIDFSASQGSRVQSTGDGIVTYSGYEKGYGQKITINHGYGYITIYAHLSKSLVRQGQKIKRGDIIALSGNTGISTGPHLHYEVHKDNVIVNPCAYFFDKAHPDKFITIQKSSPEKSGNNS